MALNNAGTRQARISGITYTPSLLQTATGKAGFDLYRKHIA